MLHPNPIVLERLGAERSRYLVQQARARSLRRWFRRRRNGATAGRRDGP